MIEFTNSVKIHNYGDLIDIMNELNKFVDDAKLGNSEYQKLSAISDELNDWKPILEATTKYVGKESEL